MSKHVVNGLARAPLFDLFQTDKFVTKPIQLYFRKREEEVAPPKKKAKSNSSSIVTLKKAKKEEENMKFKNQFTLLV